MFIKIMDSLRNYRANRRGFLRDLGYAVGFTSLASFFGSSRPAWASEGNSINRPRAAIPNRVYVVQNGDCFQNIDRLWDMLGGPEASIAPDDHVVIKGNAQWPRQGYTHTGCIKAVIDRILAMPGFSGEIYICDNVQNYGSSGSFGFDATAGYNRDHNWPDHNWNSLAAEYQLNGKPVAAKRWYNSEDDITGPQDGEGWIRSYFNFHGRDTYYSYPVFESPLTSGKMIDLKNGVWENGNYTGQAVKTIVMPTLNNHGWGGEDYAGITSGLKSFVGATEVHYGAGSLFRGHYNWHGSTFSRNQAGYAGELTARYIQEMYAPILYITGAIWSGHESRTGDAIETKTVLACENPATLDYVACRDVISPYADYLDPDQNNNTRAQILGCIAGGIGSIDPADMSIELYDFNNPEVPGLSLSGMALLLLAGAWNLFRARVDQPPQK